MKKYLRLAGTIALFSAILSCSLFDNQHTPKGYVRHCIRLLDRQALYANTPEWQQTKKEILTGADSISDMNDAHEAVSRAAFVAGGKHSRLVAPVIDTAAYRENAPEVRLLKEDIVYIILPAHSGIKVPDSLYVHTVLDFLQENLDAKGVILDLRDNSGGNMYPMIAAVSPLLPDGIVLSFKNRTHTMPVSLEYVLKNARLQPGGIKKVSSTTPLAILTNEWTASSGEATLLCFRGLEKVRTFGKPTAGYASANIVQELADGYQLLITISCDVARTGEAFCDDPIDPDVHTEKALEDAVEWIESQNQ